MTTETCTTAKAFLHDLIDRLPENVLEQAGRVLVALVDDPVYRGFLAAPLDDEPITEEDIEAIEEARADRVEGRLIPHEEIVAKYLKG